jgi:diaminohydroxyphosphoribosylaminopyrimidine deaminase/5-amino-6-(5-phosphoribosylamino)uracil reductase
VSGEDERWMGEALRLAERGRGLATPNPLVGALVVSEGRIVGRGFHARAGGPHAEVLALDEAGERARGGTLYVTLEPCNHRGRTPPCVEAILEAGVARVVAAVGDPNPRVRGGGASALRDCGVVVRVGCLEDAARRQNRVFLTAVTRGRPHVTLKSAMTLDGKIAAFDRASRWLSGAAARERAHRLRAQSDAVMVGIGTVLQDDPALTVRLDPPWPREPLRVVADSRARLPLTARLIDAGTPSRAVVAVADEAPPDRVARLEERGCTVLRCKAVGGRVDVEDLLARLGDLEVTGLLLEGGGKLAWAFVRAGLVDRVAFFLAPLLLGGAQAPTVVGGAGLPLAQALRLGPLEVRRLGPDLLIEADVLRPTETA